ncbi:MAG: type I restriction endonuclease subunit R [Nocardioides sp.]
MESLIEAALTDPASERPWISGDPRGYDAELGLYTEDLVAFVQATQGRRWGQLASMYATPDQAAQGLARRVAKELDRRTAVGVLRGGFEDRGKAFRACYFRPAHGADATALELYEANVLRVVRQVRFDPTSGESVDLVLFVNGVPTATAELKNRYTGQDYADAIKQYVHTRDPRLPLFSGRRAFVHFALDGDLAYMTTRLELGRDHFLPFNQGAGGPGQPGGKGNPPDPDGGHRTSYVWQQVWDADRWLELIQHYVFAEEPPKPKRGHKPAEAKVIFPRYHQWDVVAGCSAHARVHGAGHNYLIQHSAGSGKTKEIAWLAHELSVLHSDADDKVFDKVVVITDRRVLDAQLQQQVRAFEQTRGTVASIDQHSSQLREALEGGQARIIVTTLQKFPFVLDQLHDHERLKGRTYAVIVDEAHSSQTGGSASDLKAVLGGRTAADLQLDEDEVDGVPPALLAQLAARGRQPNLSFFAFTATPKPKTLELFGRRGPDGAFQAFHTYSMRQAIDEGFILDVLQNYTTYEQLYRLETKAREQIEVPAGQAGSRLARYAEIHPYALDQKAQVIVDHYEQQVRPMLSGTAKAMVVTASRHDAVRYKQALDQVIARGGHTDVRALVAFSGEVTITDPEAGDSGESYTEPALNAQTAGRSLPESQLPAEFAKDEYGVLVVAEKYQTGFDQPRLCAMYVDKTLTGVNAVQTLSRLNRMHPGKDRTFVIDFVNDAERVLEEFKPFYGSTEATPTDPNVLFDAAAAIRDFGVIDDADVVAFSELYFGCRTAEERAAAHGRLTGLTDTAFDTARALDEDTLAAFRDALNRLRRLYGFLAQILPFVPPQTEQLHVFCRFLEDRLRGESPAGGMSLAGTVDLTHYRLESTGTQDLPLTSDGVEPGVAIRGDGTGTPRAPGEVPMSLLIELVDLFNARYGAQLSEQDLIRPTQHIVDRVAATEGSAQQARQNEYDDFRRGKDADVLDAALDVKNINDVFMREYLDDTDLRATASTRWSSAPPTSV